MRAQIALEFIVVMSLAVIMLVVFLLIGADQLSDGADRARHDRVVDVAQTIQQELATALNVGEGYRRTFTLPVLIENEPYTITTTNDTEVQIITVSYKNKAYSVRAPKCEGTIQSGVNVIGKQNNSLWCNS